MRFPNSNFASAALIVLGQSIPFSAHAEAPSVSIRRRPQVGHRSRSRSISMSSCRFSIPIGVNAMTPSSLGP